MARFYGQPCPLCGVKLTTSDRLYASDRFLTPWHELGRFSNALMHWDCYATWHHRPRFARIYFEAKRAWAGHNPYWGIAHLDDQVLITVNPDRYTSAIQIQLAETGSGLRIALADWEGWLGGDWFEGCRHQIEREALAAVLPLLRHKMPNAEALLVATGLGPEAGSRTAAAGGMVGRISYEFACLDLAKRAATKGLACPDCGNFSTDYEFVRAEEVSESGPQSHLSCPACGSRFGPDDN